MIPSTSGRGKLPLSLGDNQFGLDHSNDCAAGLFKRLGEFEDSGERRSLLPEFKDADIGPPQVGFKAKFFLRQEQGQMHILYALSCIWHIQVIASMLLLGEVVMRLPLSQERLVNIS